MIVQISMRIILYVDQLVARETGGKIAGAASGDSNTIYDTVSALLAAVIAEIHSGLYM